MREHNRSAMRSLMAAWCGVYDLRDLVTKSALLILICLAVRDWKLYTLGGVPLVVPVQLDTLGVMGMAVIAVRSCFPEVPPLPNPLRNRVAKMIWITTVQIVLTTIIMMISLLPEPAPYRSRLCVFLLAFILALVTSLLGHRETAWLPPLLLACVCMLLPMTITVGRRILDFNLFSSGYDNNLPLMMLILFNIVCMLVYAFAPDIHTLI